MNNIFRIIWSAFRGQSIVASELAKSRDGLVRRAWLTVGLVVGIGLLSPAQAYEAGGGDDCTGTNSRVAVGTNASACSPRAIAIGHGANAGAAVVVGAGNGGNGFPDGAIMPGIAIGNQAVAIGGTAIGDSAIAGSSDDGYSVGVAIGGGATATGHRSIAISPVQYNPARATGFQSIAMGIGATSSASDAIAFGAGATAIGARSISIGSGNMVSGVGSGAIGDSTTITDAGSYSVGNDNTIDADEAGAFGSRNMLDAAATGSRIIGNDNAVDVPDAFVMGNGADVTVAEGVALGNGSLADTAGGIQGYNPTTSAADGADANIAATESTAGAVAVGDAGTGAFRQITGVAAGTEDSDVVNVAQLKASETHYYSINDGGAIQSNYSNDGATGVNSIAGGGNALAGADGAMALGFGANASAADSVALGSGSVADGSTLGSAAHQPLDTDGNPIPVAAPTAASEVSVGSAGNERRITNVAAGAEGTDAVNVSQLAAVESVASTGWDLTAQGADPTNVAPGDTVDLSNADGNLVIAKNTVDVPLEEVTFDLADDVVVNNSVSVGNVVTSATTNDITGLSNTDLSDPSFATVGRAATEEQLDLINQDLTSQGLDFAGDSGTDVQRNLGQTLNVVGGADASGNTNISTVANGTDSLEIVMTDQPQFGNVTVNTGGGDTINGLSNLTFDPNSFTSGQAATEDQLAQVSDVANTGWGLSAQGADSTSVVPGDTVDLANTDGNLVIAKNAVDGAQEDVTFDLADDVTIGNSLAINNGPTLNDNGIDMGGDTITNLGEPINGGDAVNLDYFEENQAHYYSVNDGGTIQGNYDNDGASGMNAIAAGGNAVSTADGAMALGFGSDAGILDSVALGSGSISDRAIAPDSGSIPAGSATITYNTTDKELLGAVSVGDDDSYRQITNVADGTESQDAVTVRQLQGAIGSVIGTGIKYFHANSTQPDSVAAGQDSIAVGPTTVVNGDAGIGMGNGAIVGQMALGGTAIGDGAEVMLADGMALGTASLSEAEQGIALGAGATVSHNQGVALGSNSTAASVVATTEMVIDGETYVVAGTDPASTVSVGDVDAERTVTNVAAGRVNETSTDAVNGSQLYAANQSIENLSVEVEAGQVHYFSVNDGGTQGGNYANDGASGANAVAAGVNAVATADNAIAMGADATASEIGSVALGSGATTSAAVGTANITISGQTYDFAGVSPVGTVSVGSSGAVRTITNVAAGRISTDSTDAVNGSQLHATNQAVESMDNRVSEVEGNVNELGGRVTNVEGGMANISNEINQLDNQAVKYDTNSDGSINYGNITLEDDDGTTITNVAEGDVSESSSDAVNGSQLWDMQQQITNISEGDDKYFKANSKAVAAEARGEESVAQGNHSVAAGDGAVAESEGGVALGTGSQATREGMDGAEEAFSNESVASARGAVSVGSEGGERQITNVAGGTEATDAVNVRQLESVQAGAVNYDRRLDGSVDYSSVTLGNGSTPAQIHNVAPGEAPTDAANVGQLQELNHQFNQQIGGLSNRIEDVEDGANAGVASAIAAASVPQAYLPGKSMVSAGAGTYNGESAMAVGVSRLSDNGRWAVKLNATGDSQSNFGAGVGMGFHW